MAKVKPKKLKTRVKRPVYDPTPKRIMQMYRKSLDDILEFLVKELAVESNSLTAPSVVNQAAIFRQLQTELYKYSPEVREEVQKAIDKAFKNGQVKLLLDIGKAKTLLEARQGVANSLINKHRIDAMFQDTFSDLLVATKNTETRLKRIVRESAADRLQLGVAREKGWKEISKELEKKLSAEGLSKTIKTDGFVGIVDKAGRRWQLENYTDMLVETKLRDAYIEGVRTEALQEDVDIGVISSHGAKDACRHWEGVMVSMNGKTDGLTTYDEALSSGEIFHPRCQHSVDVYRSVDLVHPSIVKKSEEFYSNR